MTPKPLKNHRVQWSVTKKVVNGDGQRGAKPSKNHWSQWFSQEKTIVSHRSQKMTIVHLYHCLFVSKTCWLRKWSEAGSHREIIHFELLTPLFWPELYAPKESPPTFLCLAAPIGRPGGLSATEGGGWPPCQGEFYKFCSPSPNNSGGGSHLPADFLKQKLLDRGHLRKGKGTNIQTY